MTASDFTYHPIGVVRTPYARRIDAPHQPTVVEGTESGAPAEATLELDAALPEAVLRDLEGDVVVRHRVKLGDVAVEDLHLLHELSQAGLLALLGAAAAHRPVSRLAGRGALRVMDHSRCVGAEPSS